MDGGCVIQIIVVLVMITLNVQVVSPDGMSRQEVIELGKSYCPSIPFCTINDTDGYDTSCCFPCSCEESCARTKTCCPDVTLTSRSPEVYSSCEDGFIMNSFYQTLRQIDSWLDPLPKFYYDMVSRCNNGSICPSLETGEEFNLEDLVAVVGGKDETLFKNKKCAECNGVYDYTRWQILIVDCKYPHSEIKNWTEGIKTCALLSYPAQGEPDRYLCSETTNINTCNVTTQWDIADTELENACLDPFSALPFNDGTWLSLSYRNVFCFLCNNPRDVTVKQSLCSFASGKSGKSVLSAFSNILQFNFDHEPSLDTRAIGEETICEASKILDTFHNVCRTLHCFDGLKPRHGRCVVPVVFAYHKIYTVEIGLYPLTTELIPIDIQTLLRENEDFFEEFWRKIKFANCEIQVKEDTSVVYTNNEGLQYINIGLAFLKSERCQYTDMVHNIEKIKIRREEMTVLLHSTAVDFLIELSQRWKYKSMSVQGLDITNMKGVKMLSFTYTIEPLQQPFACPYVVLNEPAYCQLVQHYHNISGASMTDTDNSSCPVMFDTAVYDSKYSVCIKTLTWLVEPRATGTISVSLPCVSLFGIVISLCNYFYV